MQHTYSIILLKAIVFSLMMAVSVSFAQSSSVPKSQQIVKQMYAAFGAKDMNAFKETLSDSTEWIYHGIDDIPYSGNYVGRDQVLEFIGNIKSNVDVLNFQPQQFITQDNTVVVLGSETHKIKSSNKEYTQAWVQVYTVENGLITKMEEFANTAITAQLFQQ